MKNKAMTLILIITAIAGLINLLLVKGFHYITLIYVLAMPICILSIYYAYDLAKWNVKWRSSLYHKDKYSGEPSGFAVFRTKIAAWIAYGLLLMLSILENILLPIVF